MCVLFGSFTKLVSRHLGNKRLKYFSSLTDYIFTNILIWLTESGSILKLSIRLVYFVAYAFLLSALIRDPGLIKA